MKKTVKLEGLDCANCAAKIEKAIQKVEGVQEASVNFVTTKLAITLERENLPEVMERVTQTIHKIDRDIVLTKA